MPSREILERNAEALRATQPALANGLLEIPDEVLNKFEPLEIPEAPEDRIREFASHAKNIEKMDALMLLGLGTPFLLNCLRENISDDVALIVLEPSLELAFKLLSQVDLSEVFAKPYTTLVIAGDDIDLQRQIEGLIAKFGLSDFQLVMNPMRPLGEEVANLSVALIRNSVENVRVAEANVSRYGTQIIENIAANLDAVKGAPNVDGLAESLDGKPAIIVGAGPSLDANIEAIKEASGEVVVIAVDAALSALTKASIPVDMVVSLDVIGEKAAFREHLTPEMMLISLLGAHPSLVSRREPRTAFVSDEHPLSRWCASVLGLPLFPSMGNVAHLALMMAKGMGAGGVLFVGVDFALGEGGKLYADVTGRGDEGLSKELSERLVDGRSFAGKAVKTLPNMIGYANTLAAFCMPSKGTVFNVNEDALAVGPVVPKSFKDFMAEYGKGSIERPIGEATTTPLEDERLALLLSEMGPLENELRAFAADASAFADQADAARHAVNSGKKAPSEAIAALSEGAGLFARHRGVIDMVEPLQPAVSFEIAKLTREMSVIEDAVERATKQLFTLSGPAAGGAAIAEIIADRLRQAGEKIKAGQ